MSLVLKKSLKKRFSEAVNLKNSGDLESAKKILAELSEEDPESVVILATLGDVYWDLKLLHESVAIFKRAVVLAPELEAVSLGLFHTLWKLNKRDEAFEEIKRFMSVSDSQDYRDIIDEINNLPDDEP